MKTTLLMLLMSSLALPVATVSAQESKPTAEERERVRQELRDTEKKVQELRRQLARDYSRAYQDQARAYAIAPRVLSNRTLFGRRARLGVNIRMNADDAADRRGAVLESVVEDGPAAKAGLEAGDVITHWDGEPLVGRYPAADEGESEPATKLIDLARELEEGDAVELTYLRDGQSHKTTVEAAELVFPALAGNLLRYRDFDGDGKVDISLPLLLSPGDRVAISGFGVWPQGRWGEMELLKLTPQLGEYFGTDRGLLVIEAPDEDTLGLEVGDVILTVGDREPRDTRHLMRILRNYDSGETINVEVMRHQQRVTLSAEVPEDGSFGEFGLLRGLTSGGDRSI